MTKPSNDSRTPGRHNRIRTIGANSRIRNPSGMAKPVMRILAVLTGRPSASSSVRATATSVAMPQPTPNATPSTAVITRVTTDRSANASVSLR